MTRPEQLPGWEPAPGGCWTRLRAAMDELAVSCNELVKNSGVSRQRISEYRAGRHLPNGYSMLRIARALDCHVEQLWRLPIESRR